MTRRARLRRRDPGHDALFDGIEDSQPWERPESDLDIDLKLYELLTGFDHFGLGFADLAEIKAAWKLVGERFTEEHARRRPGTRPWAWWKFDAPELRRMLEGSAERISPVAETWFGMPTAHACAYESETAYLERLQLWYVGERPPGALFNLTSASVEAPTSAEAAGQHSAAQSPDPGTQYALDVVAGAVPACKAIRWACQRHLDDLEDGWRRGLFFDRRAAAYRLAFCRFLRHFQGATPGEVFEPSDWQCFVLGNVWGWMTADDWRRFSSYFLFLPRRVGKTWTGATDMLFMNVASGEAAPDIFAVATKRDQAAKSVKDAIGICDASPLLDSDTRHSRRLIKGPKWVACDRTGGMIETKTSEAGSELGDNVAMGLVDEAAVHPDDSNAQQLRDSMGSRGQQRAGDLGKGGGPLLAVITSAGVEKEAYGGQEYDLGKRILDPEDDTTVDSHFVFITELDDVLDDDGQVVASAREDIEVDGVTVPARWKDPLAWREAIPNLGIAKSETDLRRLVDKAQADPGKIPNLLIYHFNLWEASALAWLPWNHWIRCQQPDVDARLWRQKQMDRLAGCRCFGGLDLGDRWDMSAFGLWFPEERVYLVWYWMPEENLRLRVRRDHVPYDRWAKAGFLKTIPGNSTDVGWITRDIVGTGDTFEGSLMDQFDIVGVWCDPWFAKEAVTDLEAAGLETHICRQIMTHLAEPSAKLKSLVRSEDFDHGGNPVLGWNARNAVAVRKPSGEEMPDKGRAQRNRIDGLSAFNLCLRGHLDTEDEGSGVDAWLEEKAIREGAESA